MRRRPGPHTRRSCELVAVDDGSDGGTPAYLDGVRDAAAVPVTVLAAPEGRGFPAACYPALRAARGDCLVLLDPGAVVADGWLDQLVALAESDPRVDLTSRLQPQASCL